MTTSSIQPEFFSASAKPKSKSKKRLPPLSFRATLEERALLKAWAGTRPVGTYIREQLFGDAASPRRRRVRRPAADQEAIGKALALLGQSRLSSNMNQIAKAVNMGELPVSPDLETDLDAACSDIRQMREALIEALNLKSRD